MQKITVCDNGLRVITCEMPQMESVTLGLWIGIGGRYESKKLNGISHFLEHLLFKGTEKRSAARISRVIESVGGSLNGFTAEEYTCYFAKVLHRHLRLACDILSDMYLHSVLCEEDIEREKGVIREEINLYLDTPQHYVLDLFGRALWGDHPLGRSLVGTHETIGSLNRGALAGYLKKSYTSRNTIVAAAGRLRHGKLVELVQHYLPRGSRSGAPRCIPAKAQRGPVSALKRKKTEQTHLCVGMRGYQRDHDDRFALQLLNVSLGGNMSSRLFQKIREKHGLAYAIHSSAVRLRDTGAFIICAGVEHKKFLRALRMILRELVRVRERGLFKTELAAAKEYCIGQLSMGLEKTSPNMMRLGESLICTGHVLTKEEIVSNLSRVRLEDVQRVARDLFTNDTLSLSAIGPLPEKDEVIAQALRL